MATRDERIRRLKALAGEEPTDAARRDIAKALGTKFNRVVEAAARTVEAWGEDAFADELKAAFDRFMEDGSKSDPGCAAKTAIVRALHATGHADFDVYLRASRYRQPEAVFGGSEDTAAELRVTAAQALTEFGYPEWDFVLTRLLADSESSVQRGAAHILGQRGGREAELLLRLKASTERDPDIVGVCLEGLMAANADRSCDFVSGFLARRDVEIVEAAALALGASRLPKAFDLLHAAWRTAFLDLIREALVLPMAIHRSEESFAFLLDVLRNGRAAMAARTIEALGIFRDDSAKRSSIADAIAQRSEREVHAAFARVFESETA